ncbi:MAG: dihydrofolate reductase [Alphaproteobacteria bacterium]|nr:MAG: dihydrofolate reductase [Alphaproteobacteria bacterium]
MVAARARGGVIGHEGGLPWHLPEDLRHFKALTLGKPVVMGRKTHQSIGRPLPGRDNIVISRNRAFAAPGCQVARSLGEALAAAGPVPEIMIIGGAQIYALALPLAGRLYLTDIDIDIAGDAHFPPIDEDIWHEVKRTDCPARGERPAFSFRQLERRTRI